MKSATTTFQLVCCICALLIGAPTHAQAGSDTGGDIAAASAAEPNTAATAALASELVNEIAKLSGYRAASALPHISQVPHDVLAAHACSGPCRVVKAAYVPGEGIYIEDKLDPEHNKMDRSIVLHELVHYLQEQSGKFADLGPCARNREEELEAYSLQNAYLASVGSGLPMFLSRNSFRCD